MCDKCAPTPKPGLTFCCMCYMFRCKACGLNQLCPAVDLLKGFPISWLLPELQQIVAAYAHPTCFENIETLLHISAADIDELSVKITPWNKYD
uniref:Uncharacterized protein n=1 Tax=viral metagenome TaxID=1070528 RepID=A0A6C0BMF8_9ZZZZ